MRKARGFVLAGTLAVLVIAAALIGGAFFYALQEERIGRSARASVRALAAAEAAADAALLGAPPLELFLPGDSITVTPSLPPQLGTAVVTLRALGDHFVLSHARGRDSASQAEREVALLARIRMPPFAAPAALTSTGPVSPEIAAAVNGSDHVPAGSTCPAAGPAVPAVAAAWAGSWEDWDSVVTAARGSSGLPGPGRPVIFIAGDAAFMGGTGSGILLVGGNAQLDGGTQLTGILVVRGELSFRGAGGQIAGAVRAGSVVAEASALAGGPLVRWSRCAVVRARRAAGVTRRAFERAWADLSGGW